MAHILVLGAGITGVTTAYALLERGHDVTVVEKHRYPAMETSFANGGQLSASNAEVWNNWSTILKGLKWMLRRDAPLLINLRPNYHKYSWMAEFCGQILHYRPNTVETTRLAIAARDHLFHMAECENIDFDLERRGILHLYYDDASLRKAAESNKLLAEGGLERYQVSPEEMHSIEPALHGDFAGGFFTPSDCTGDIHKFTSGLARACEKRGARFLFNAPVSGISATEEEVSLRLVSQPQDPIRADALVICAGVASRHFAAMLGDRINIYPVKGYSITVNLEEEQSRQAAPTVSLLDEDAKIVTSRLGGERFRVAGTAEFNGVNKDIRADRIAPLLRWCERLFPDMCTRSVVPWAGLRPMTPSMLPRVGPGKRPHIFYNTGHGHLGWTLSAATAQLVAEQVHNQTSH
ncbi:D-amino acid dehydrogenase [Altericroceibacterium spongiae]|uniref:D-amino acid dehydrogenase n=1 Tax=Altericroceibacterium spongiae TaxID=2320269 RepID=A0A420EP54_9SPHN|nr:D-amino acid dehydrogenase [Altericroceibacterium spongiae]RKF22457.1 D-amino acid dehydrogenase [Altericroceibacterium spongiae]